jgi:hypothetical protein
MAVKEGTTVINVRTSNFYWAHCTITVTAKPVSVTGVSVSPTSATLDIKGTKQLSATISPSNATDKSVTWSSSNSSVAKVSSSGLVTGVANGSATITAKTSDGGYTATCAITVNTVIITIKDAKFKSYLVSNFDTNGDGEISTVEAAVVTTISCPAVGISFLDGIEYFTSLQFLSVNSNSLTTLNLSKNTKLKELQCFNNYLYSLDISKNTALTTVLCYTNHLSSLDASKMANPGSFKLYCGKQSNSSDKDITMSLTLSSSQKTQWETLKSDNTNKNVSVTYK